MSTRKLLLRPQTVKTQFYRALIEHSSERHASGNNPASASYIFGFPSSDSYDLKKKTKRCEIVSFDIVLLPTTDLGYRSQRLYFQVQLCYSQENAKVSTWPRIELVSWQRVRWNPSKALAIIRTTEIDPHRTELVGSMYEKFIYSFLT